MPDEHRTLWQDSPTVALGRVVHLPLPDGFTTRGGARLTSIQVSYECWGSLNAARDNAVLLIHLLTTDPHATGEFAGQQPGWWEPLVGPGRALDTDRFFVVCPNLLGGCHGTTGPRFPAPEGGPYLERFPLLAPVDLMRCQRLFVRALGIDRLRAVIGPSIGGMVAWEWAIEAGDEVDLVAVIAAPLRTTAYQIGLNWLQRRGIELDLGDNEAMARWGQMVARGVGMLSYRSPVGLEERFGRDWFKAPGELLGQRGMFNIESWLRHHGRRNVRRFDPYTYILFSRAMDLHDVGEGRDGVVAALDRVRCGVLVVGVSSDQLYPPADVHLGADILSNLGKKVEYAEIRSPHGHDAVLLETSQLDAILRDMHVRAPRPVPSAASRAVQTARIGVLGAGQVAAEFLHLVDERRDWLLDEFGLRVEVVSVAEIDRNKRLDPVFSRVEVTYDPWRLVSRDDLDVVVELTRGLGALPLVEAALAHRRPVVTTNKALARHAGPALEHLAAANGVRLAYHNAIAAGWPLLHLVERPLGREHVASIRAVLSATCNVVLEQIEQGADFDDALIHAVRMGLTEPDPDLDVSGWDTAQKLTMLVARARGRRYLVEDLLVTGLTEIDPLLVREAPTLGLRVKLIGLYVAGVPAPVIGVLPVAVPADGHLGGVRGDYNVVVLDGGADAELVQLGRGGGGLPVAMGALNDLVGIFRPTRSWTGRYPPASVRPEAPRFALFLARRGSSIVITDLPEGPAVPTLDSLQQGSGHVRPGSRT